MRRFSSDKHLGLTLTGILAGVFALYISAAVVAETLEDYAKECDRLTESTVPAFDCDVGSTEIPTTHLTKHPIVDTCDRPQQLREKCDPGSKFLVLSKENPDPDVQVVANCRKGGLKEGRYDDIAVIQHNAKTGYTCFYQAIGSNLSGKVEAPIKGTQPWYGDGGSEWQTPARTVEDGCGACHDNGAILRSPYLAQLRNTKALKEPNALPGAGDDTFNGPNDPYCFVGEDFASWHVYKVKVESNTCTSGCHRMGVSNIPRIHHQKEGEGPWGTSLLFGLRATQEKPSKAKNPHSADSPLWMTPGSKKYTPENLDAATAIANCAKQFSEGGPLPDTASCRIVPINIDPCLIGKWEASELVYPTLPNQVAGPGMGTGFTVEFKCDGTQTVDYAKMTTIELPYPNDPSRKDKINYSGTATGQIFTFHVKGTNRDSTGEAKTEQDSIKSDIRFKIETSPQNMLFKLDGTWGPAGLGAATGDNSYTCGPDKLTYKGTNHRDRRPNVTVTLKRLKE